MSIKIFTLNEMKKVPFTMKLYGILESCIFSYLLIEDNSVGDAIEEKMIEFLKKMRWNR